MQKKLQNNNQGFTLIELIIVMAILGIFMITATRLITSTTATYRTTNKVIELQNVANSTLDSMSDVIMQATDVSMISDGKTYVSEGTVTNAHNYMVVNKDFSMYGVDDLSDYKLEPAGRLGGSALSLRACEATKKDVEKLIVQYKTVDSSDATVTKYAYYLYVKDDQKLYVKRSDTKEAPTTTDNEYLLCENLKTFQLSTDIEGNAVALYLTYDNGNITYESKDVVMIRNSNVLHMSHDYNYKVLQ